MLFHGHTPLWSLLYSTIELYDKVVTHHGDGVAFIDSSELDYKAPSNILKTCPCQDYPGLLCIFMTCRDSWLFYAVLLVHLIAVSPGPPL